MSTWSFVVCRAVHFPQTVLIKTCKALTNFSHAISGHGCWLRHR
jgi:hypothetical protein